MVKLLLYVFQNQTKVSVYTYKELTPVFSALNVPAQK